MSNSVFPSLPGLSWGLARKPMWKTNVREAASGREYRSTSWTSPRWEYTLSYEFLREGNGKTELSQLLAFFNNHYGSWDSWLYLDPDYNTVTDLQIGTGNGIATQFQLLRSIGGNLEPIYAVSGTPVFKVNGSVVTGTVGANGVVTLAAAPADASVVSWSGQYYQRCRFADDYVNPSKFLKDLHDLRQLRFITVKP